MVVWEVVSKKAAWRQTAKQSQRALHGRDCSIILMEERKGQLCRTVPSWKELSASSHGGEEQALYSSALKEGALCILAWRERSKLSSAVGSWSKSFLEP